MGIFFISIQGEADLMRRQLTKVHKMLKQRPKISKVYIVRYHIYEAELTYLLQDFNSNKIT